jgi:hypothetical protein
MSKGKLLLIPAGFAICSPESLHDECASDQIWDLWVMAAIDTFILQRLTKMSSDIYNKKVTGDSRQYLS